MPTVAFKTSALGQTAGILARSSHSTPPASTVAVKLVRRWLVSARLRFNVASFASTSGDGSFMKGGVLQRIGLP